MNEYERRFEDYRGSPDDLFFKRCGKVLRRAEFAFVLTCLAYAGAAVVRALRAAGWL